MASRRAGLLRRLEAGLYSSVNGNPQAFRFSITVTVCFGVASRLQSRPTLTDPLLFALAGVVAFSALNLFVALRLRTQVTQIRSARATSSERTPTSSPPPPLSARRSGSNM